MHLIVIFRFLKNLIARRNERNGGGVEMWKQKKKHVFTQINAANSGNDFTFEMLRC